MSLTTARTSPYQWHRINPVVIISTSFMGPNPPPRTYQNLESSKSVLIGWGVKFQIPLAGAFHGRSPVTLRLGPLAAVIPRLDGRAGGHEPVHHGEVALPRGEKKRCSLTSAMRSQRPFCRKVNQQEIADRKCGSLALNGAATSVLF